MTTETNACETPLLDLLRSVPLDARDLYSHGGPFETRSIPYGRHCHAAAAEIARLQAQLSESRQQTDALFNTGMHYCDKIDALKAQAREDAQRRIELAAAIDSKDAEIAHLKSRLASASSALAAAGR